MNNRNKILVGCLALLLVLSAGYALFSETIEINGTATAKGSFDIGVTCQTGLANTDGLANNAINNLKGPEDENNYSEDSCTVVDNAVNFKTNLNAPGAMRYYTIKATNNGTIDALVPVIGGNKTTQACMKQEMENLINGSVNALENACRSRLFTRDDGLTTNYASVDFEDLSFAYIIEKKDGTLINLLEMPEEEAMAYVTEDGEKVKLDAGNSVYFVGKMYIPKDYEYSSSIKMIDFDLSANYTLNFVQQTN